MRKWLVGLLAAGLCASSAWAVTDTLTSENFTATSTTYTEFSNVTTDSGSGAVFAGKTSKNASGAIQMRTTGSDCGIVTTASGGTASKVTITWNDASGDDRKVSVYGKTDAYSAASDLFNSTSQGTKIGDIQKGTSVLEITEKYTFIGLRSSNGALYLDKVEIEWDGEPTPVEFSIALNPAEDFDVVQNKSASITATVRGAQGNVTYSWSIDDDPIDLAGNVYEIDSTDLGGPYTVKCEADDGVSAPVSASVKYKVVEAPVIDGDQLTRETTGVSGTSYKDWTATGDSGTVYAGNSAGGNSSIQLNTGSPKGIVITESAGQDVASVTVEWNDATTAGRKIEIYGSTAAYDGPADLYGEGKGELLGEIAKGDTTLAVPEGYPYVGILAKGGALYLSSVTFGFAGASAPSIAFTGETEKNLPDAAFELVFTLKNYEGDYTWRLVEGEGNLGEGGMYTWSTSEAGEYTIKVAAVNGELLIAQKEVTLTAVAAYTVSVADGIENGSVELKVDGAVVESPAQLAAGTQVTVVATPDQGYQLDQILINGQELEANPFAVDSDAEISATFSEKPVLPGVTYTITGTNTAEITSGEAPEGASFEYASTYNKIYQLTKGNSMTLTLKGYEGQKVTGLTLSMHSNGSGGAGSLSATCGDATIASIETSNFKDGWSTAYTTNWVAVTPAVTATEIDGDIEITIAATVNSLYCESITVEYEAAGPATPSVAYTGETEKTLPEAAFELVFTLKNYDGAYTWTLVDGEGNLGEGGMYTWTAEEAGEYTIKVAAINGELLIAQKEVTLKVNGPVIVSPITIGEIANGSVVASLDGETVTVAPSGATITLTATADSGYKFSSMSVTYGGTTIPFDSATGTFVMPGEEVFVSAEFEEFEAPAVYVTFEEGTYPTSYAATEAEVKNFGTLEETIPTVKFAVAQTYRGSEANDKKVGAVSLRMRAATSGDVATNAVFGNAEAFAEAITSLGFQYARYGNDTAPTELKVQVSADGENWDELVDLASTVTAELQTYSCDEIPAGSVFFRILMTSSAKSFKRVNIDEIALEFGPASPKITYTGETTAQLPDGVFSLQFALANYDGAFEWVLDSREGGSIDQNGLYTWAPTEAGEVTIKVVARNGELDIASKEVPLRVNAQPGEPKIEFDGPTNGVVQQELSCTVTPVNFENPTVYFEGNFEAPEGSSLMTQDIDFDGSVCKFTPDVAGVYWIEFCAYEGDSEEGICDKWTVTVSDEPGPQPTEAGISTMTITGNTMRVEFFGEGAQVLLSPDLVNWTAVEGATSPYEIIMGSEPQYIGVR
jgi:hypothetical protein